MSLTANGEPLNLLRTKLFRPRPTGDLLHRERLNEALDRYCDRTVTLVCAPAGFGKTTLLTDWLEQSQYPNAWLSLDKGDGDLRVFLTYFVAAVRTLFPAACAETRDLLHAPVLPPRASLVTSLVNDLDRLADDPALPESRRFVLVLDDFHLVREPAVHSLMGELLRHPPRTVHLVLSARQDPPFLDHSIRARGDFSELRVAEMRFTPEEATSFMQQTLQVQLNAESLAALIDSTEGWGTGLRLTALTLKAGWEIYPSEPASYNRYTSDYLLAEVLAHVPSATQDFLLRTSILDRLSGPLCDAIAPPPDPDWDGSAYLRWLTAENIFIFSLDAQGNWYRYHHLFQKLLQAELQRRLSRAEVAELHRRAAAWYAEHNLIQEAIGHALAAGDELLAAQLVATNCREAMNHERWRQVSQWLGLLPRNLIDARPELLLLEAWIVQSQWRFTDLPAHLDRVEALTRQLPADDPDRARLVGEVETLRSLAYYYGLDWRRSFASAERALATLPMESSTARGTAWMYFAAGHFAAGNVRGATDTLYEGLREDRFHGNGFPARPYIGLCQIYWMQGNPVNLFLAATQLLQLAQQRGLGEATGWAHYFRGCARYQQNDLIAAKEEFEAVMRLRHSAHTFTFSQAAFGLIMTLAGLGEVNLANEMLNFAASYGLEVNNTRAMADAEGIRACLARRAGSLAEAYRWATAFDPNTPLVPLTTFSVPHMVRARILVADGSAASLAAAASDLARIQDLAVATHNIRYLSEVLALQAMIQDGQGNRRVAFDILANALRLAEPGSLIRVFADLGAKMRDLLRQFVTSMGGNEFSQRILATFGDQAIAAPAAAQPAAVQPVRASEQWESTDLLEPLSRRELDVLLLLSERLTDKEIARELFVSPQTVKRHASNIYQKLDVGNRRDAVAKAISFGLLPVPTGHRRSLERQASLSH